MFHSIPAISCTGAARKWGLVSHADFVHFSCVRSIELCMFFVQVTIVLRERLEAIDVEVSVETFEEQQGIAGLGEDPFVSYKLVVLATHSDDCVVLTGRLRHSLVTSVAFLLCV